MPKRGKGGADKKKSKKKIKEKSLDPGNNLERRRQKSYGAHKKH